MEKEFSSFRKATFGGFNRKDVINYIEKMRNESHEYKKQVEETVKNLNEKIRELENAARLMESTESEELPEASADTEGENLGDIGQATKHLKTVADELCRSLGDFIDKLSERGIFDKEQECVSEKETDEITAETEVMSLVDDILASISYLGNSETKAVEKPVEAEKKENISEILLGYSFLR